MRVSLTYKHRATFSDYLNIEISGPADVVEKCIEAVRAKMRKEDYWEEE